MQCDHCEGDHMSLECPLIDNALHNVEVTRHGADLSKMTCYGDERQIFRKKILKETIFMVMHYGLSEMRVFAKNNLSEWKQKRQKLHALRHVTAANGIYNVIEVDWGDCTHRLTKLYGEVFAVLNFANAYYPGGGYQKGASAQEENIMRRTNLHFELKGSQIDMNTRQYKPDFTKTLEANHADKLIHMHWDENTPDIVFRGSEENNYQTLEASEFFPFAELRGAALDVKSVSLSDDEIRAECRRRIKAQFATLTHNKIRHVVLGAFGCGAFGNDPYMVATVYVEEIKLVRTSFDVIVFAIILSDDNVDAFQMAFENLHEPLLNLDEQEILAGYSENKM